MTAGSKLWYA
jgi:hypothetical protein